MQWVADKLSQGQSVQYRPRGNSMSPRIKGGKLVIVNPAAVQDVEVGDIVFCKVKGRYYLHLVGAKRGKKVRIENARGYINGWTSRVLGKL